MLFDSESRARWRDIALSIRDSIEVRREHLRQPFHQRLQPLGHAGAVRVQQRHRHWLGPELRQHLDQPARGDQRRESDLGRLDQARIHKVSATPLPSRVGERRYCRPLFRQEEGCRHE